MRPKALARAVWCCCRAFVTASGSAPAPLTDGLSSVSSPIEEEEVNVDVTSALKARCWQPLACAHCDATVSSRKAPPTDGHGLPWRGKKKKKQAFRVSQQFAAEEGKHSNSPESESRASAASAAAETGEQGVTWISVRTVVATYAMSSDARLPALMFEERALVRQLRANS